MITTSSKPTSVKNLAGKVVRTFKSKLHGDLVQPGDKEYHNARKVYNAMIDKQPGMIAYCDEVADVVKAVRFAGDYHLDVAVRGGGHSGAGLGICDDGLCIDLSRMKKIKVDPQAKTVLVEGGCTWGEVDAATHMHGLAMPSGIISTTGVGGLTLGGGHGHLSRKFGLTIDNLLEADVVLATGEVVTANEQEHPDLFWAIRGGGGNFGVVTSFLFRLFRVNMVYAGPMLWDIDKAADILKWYRDFLPAAPEELNGFFAFMTVPPAPSFPEHLHLQKVCGIVWCHCGNFDRAEQILSEVREMFPPIFEHVGAVPYPAIQSAFDALYPAGHNWYWRGDFVKDIPDEAIEQHVKYGKALPTMQSTMHLYPIDAAVNRVGKEETAFSFREAKWSQVIVGVDSDASNNERITKWTKDYWKATHPYSLGGAYVNFMMEEGQDRIKATYRDNYDRLLTIKQQYDPTNLFHINQNIKASA